MNYKFYTEKIENLTTIGVLPENDDFKILFRFGDTDWTPQKAKEIIDGIENSKESPKGQEYIWANEDVTLYCNINGVFLIDIIGERAGETEPEKLILRLTHEQFVNFMIDFKQFIEENS